VIPKVGVLIVELYCIFLDSRTENWLKRVFFIQQNLIDMTAFAMDTLQRLILNEELNILP